MRLTAWYGVIALLVLTRFWPYGAAWADTWIPPGPDSALAEAVFRAGPVPVPVGPQVGTFGPIRSRPTNLGLPK